MPPMPDARRRSAGPPLLSAESRTAGQEDAFLERLNAPLPFTDTTVSPFADAMATVLAAYESFSPALADSFGFCGRAAHRRAGSEGSAAERSTPVCFSRQPAVLVTFLNYLGSTHDVMTLAHGLGHGFHGILAGEKQGPLMYHPPTAY